MADDGGLAEGRLGATFAKDAMERAVDAMMALTFDGVITWANDAVRVLGWPPEELVGRRIFDLVATDDLDRRMQGARAIGRGFQLPSSAPFDLVGPDGSRTNATSPRGPWVPA